MRAEFTWTFYRSQPFKLKARKAYRNAIALALEWRRAIDTGEYSSQADLARGNGISRARVTQIPNLLRLFPRVIGMVTDLGDPLPSPLVTERQRRPLINRRGDSN